jgi:hypothetical protein
LHLPDTFPQVDVLWLLNTKCKEWEDALPEDTRALLASPGANRGDSKSLKDYPYVSTFDANYSPFLTSLLSQQASWTAMQARSQLQDMASTSSS